MVTWLAWMAIALATLVATVSLWITWQRLSDTYRRPAEAGTPEEVPSEGQPEVGHDDPPPAVLGELDERATSPAGNSRWAVRLPSAVLLLEPGSSRVSGASKSRSTPGTMPAFGWRRRLLSTRSSTLTQGRASSVSTNPGVVPIRQENPRTTSVGGGTPPTDKWRGFEGAR
jgi:hypothetical protein